MKLNPDGLNVLRCLLIVLVVWSGSLFRPGHVAAGFPEQTRNLSHPASSLEADLRIRSGHGYIVSRSGTFRFSLSMDRSDSRLKGKWIKRPPEFPTIEYLGYRGKKYRRHSGGIEVESASGREVIPLDGYEANKISFWNDRVWAATLGGLYRLEKDRFIRENRRPAISLARDSEALYVLTPHHLLRRGKHGLDTYPIPGPRHNHISALHRTSNRLYVGTFNHGVSVFDGNGWNHIREGLPSLRVNSFAEYDNEIWVATSGGVAVLKGDTVEERTPRWWHSPVADFARAGGYLHICGGSQMARYDGRDWWVKYESGNPFWQTATNFENSAVCGGMEGMKIFEGDTMPHKYQLAEPWITALYQENDRLWLGSYDSDLSLFDRGNGITQVDTDVWVTPRSLEKRGDYLLVGTRGDGIRIYRDASLEGQLGSADGLIAEEVSALEVDPRGVWVGFRHGLIFLPGSDPMFPWNQDVENRNDRFPVESNSP